MDIYFFLSNYEEWFVLTGFSVEILKYYKKIGFDQVSSLSFKFIFYIFNLFKNRS